MVNKFAAIGCSGVVVSVVCLTAAAIIGGKALDHGFDLGFWDHRARCDTGGDRQITRSFAWDGDDTVSIHVPANVQYRPGPGQTLEVRGDEGAVSHLRLRHGRIDMDCRGGDGDLAITLPGRIFRVISMFGSGDLTLEDVDQPALEIKMAGSGDVKGSGKVDKLVLGLAGSGDADFGQLASDFTAINIAGSGDVDVMPKGLLDVRIAGSGDVTLHSEPSRIEQHIFGSGEIIHAAQ
jgi:hypothetical protein